MIHLESVELGSSYTWVEEAYGERGVIALGKLNLTGFAERGDVRKMFGKRFPKVRKRLEISEKIVAAVSAKIDVPMRLVYEEVTTQLVEFRIGAIVDGRGLDFDSKKARVETAINALKESYDDIVKYERENL